MVPKSTNMTSSSRCSQQQQDPSLLSLPLDALGYIMTILEPRDVCSFACAAHHTAILSHARRKSVLLARSCGKVHLRLVRYRMQARSTFVAHYCQLEHLADRETCQGRLLKSLKVSCAPAYLMPRLLATIHTTLSSSSSSTGILAPNGITMTSKCAPMYCPGTLTLATRAVAILPHCR